MSMVKPIMDAVKNNRQAFDWVAKFGAAVVIGLYLVYVMSSIFSRLVDHQIEVGEKNSDAMFLMAKTSQQIADETTAMKNIQIGIMGSQKESNRHDNEQASFWDKSLRWQTENLAAISQVREAVLENGKKIIDGNKVASEERKMFWQPAEKIMTKMASECERRAESEEKHATAVMGVLEELKKQRKQ